MQPSWHPEQGVTANPAEVDTMGVRRAIIRTGPVLGPNSPILSPILLQFKLFAGGTSVVHGARFMAKRGRARQGNNTCSYDLAMKHSAQTLRCGGQRTRSHLTGADIAS